MPNKHLKNVTHTDFDMEIWKLPILDEVWYSTIVNVNIVNVNIRGKYQTFDQYRSEHLKRLSG